MSASRLLDEYELARADLGLDDQQLASIARTSIISSGAPVVEKTRAIAAVDTWLPT